MKECTKEDNWIEKTIFTENETRRFVNLTPAMTPEEIESAIAETPCPKDSDTAMSLAASVMGRKGGLSKSPKKLAAIRKNSKLGGWPKGKPRGPRTAGGEAQAGTTWPQGMEVADD